MCLKVGPDISLFSLEWAEMTKAAEKKDSTAKTAVEKETLEKTSSFSFFFFSLSFAFSFSFFFLLSPVFYSYMLPNVLPRE